MKLSGAYGYFSDACCKVAMPLAAWRSMSRLAFIEAVRFGHLMRESEANPYGMPPKLGGMGVRYTLQEVALRSLKAMGKVGDEGEA